MVRASLTFLWILFWGRRQSLNPNRNQRRDMGAPLNTIFTSSNCYSSSPFSDISTLACTSKYSAIMHSCLAYATEADSPTLGVVWKIQHPVTWLVRGFRQLPYEKRLHRLNFYALERRNLQGYINRAFNIFNGAIEPNPVQCLPRPTQYRLSGPQKGFLQRSSRVRWRSGSFLRVCSEMLKQSCHHQCLSVELSMVRNLITGCIVKRLTILAFRSNEKTALS